MHVFKSVRGLAVEVNQGSPCPRWTEAPHRHLQCSRAPSKLPQSCQECGIFQRLCRLQRVPHCSL